MPSVPGWEDDPEDEARLSSSIALATFALTHPRVHPDHRKRLLNEAIWFVTERGSVSRKYLLRYRTDAALAIQEQMTASAAAKSLHHEHVQPGKWLVQRLLDRPSDVAAILGGAQACVVTHEEHARLNQQSGVTGWDRYAAAGLTVVDLATGQALDSATLTARGR